ncbi:MAG: GntR family transcriptional regulator [Candidatus Latescibacteria bacterium]|nr:GntR family transcriptional regulator [Candidatus Latescibacterota bacterium]
MAFLLDPTRPIYLQIMEEIKKRAVRGLYRPGEQLPSVRDMAKEMEVNPNTIARVYRELEQEGFIETRRGRGSFITEDSSRIEAERTKFGRDATQRFIRDITELDMTDKQIQDMLSLLKRSFSGADGKDKSTGEGTHNVCTGE